MSTSKTVVIIATLDTKGIEASYLKEQIEQRGHKTIVVDSGMRGTPTGVEPNITRGEVARAAGSSIEYVEKLGRGPAEEIMMKGVVGVVRELYASGRLDGVIAIGGSDGATLATVGMRALPLGVPKLMVTPFMMHCAEFAGTKDVMFLHSVMDILGINSLSKRVYDEAIGAIVGMVEAEVETEVPARNMIAATMYGNTTPCVMKAKGLLEEKGYEVVVFSPNIGSRAMEELVEQGFFVAVLDVTTQDVTDALLGGLYPAWPGRLEAAGEAGIPQVVVPGCVDFTLAGPLSTLPPEYRERKTYHFSPLYTLVRVVKEEMETIGEIFAEKLNKASGPTVVLFPLRGLSMYNKEGEALYDPLADRAFLRTLKENLKPHIKIIEVDAHINDPLFAETCVSTLLNILKES